MADDPGSLGIVLGGSGNGEQMAANKVKGIRAALCWTAELAQLAREHNDAQVVSIGGRFTATELAKEIVDVFLATEFSGVERHVRRLEMVTRFEQDGIAAAGARDRLRSGRRRRPLPLRMRGSPVWGKMPTLRLGAT